MSKFETIAENRRTLKPLAFLAAGLTGADIERLVRELRGRARREGKPLTWTSLEQALRQGRSLLSSVLARRVAVHELGHALAYLGYGIAEVTSVRIGGARGGETHTRVMTEDIQDEEGVMTLIACILAGQVAEKLVYGSALVGCGGAPDSDLARATKLALELETGLGAGSDMPLLHRPPSNPSDVLLSNPELAKRVNLRLLAAEDAARLYLVPQLGLLRYLTDFLVEMLVIDGQDLDRLIDRYDASQTG